jgi:hypothetical protein
MDDEQAVIKRILALRATTPKPTTWAAIADRLNTEKVPPPSGSAWYSMTVRRIAQRQR